MPTWSAAPADQTPRPPSALNRERRHSSRTNETRDFTRAAVDAATLFALCDSVGFGPLTRRRLREVAGIEFASA